MESRRKTQYMDLTICRIVPGLVRFALPMIAGDLLQQVYNLTDTLIVGQFLGKSALAAVGSAYALMTFLTSVFLGLSMGAGVLSDILRLSLLTCLQQSCMNFGILLVQRLVDSFGAVTMAAFAAGVKIDTFAYLPVQDFGNAFSIFISQNSGAGKADRQRKGFLSATLISTGFSALLSLLVCRFARPLMQLFVQPGENEVLTCGVRYLQTEGAFYVGIGCLFLLYGFYRGIGRPGISLLLTVV